MAGDESKDERHARRPEVIEGAEAEPRPDAEGSKKKERPAPAAGSPDYHDRPPAGRDPHSPWLGGG